MKASVHTGVPLSEGVEAALDIWIACQPFWEAWTTLHRAREYGYSGPLGIRYSEIVAYASRNSYDAPVDFDELCYLIGEQEAEYMDWVAQQEKARSQPKVPNGR